MNMLSQARHVIKSLQRDDSILVLPADKGRAMVVMDVVEYVKDFLLDGRIQTSVAVRLSQVLHAQ